MASRKFNKKKYQIKRLSRRDEVGSKRCGYTPLPKPEPVVPVVTAAPKKRAKKSTK